jgi:hypothetical protein
MAYADARQKSLLRESLRATLLAETVGTNSQKADEGEEQHEGMGISISSALTALMGHGGLYSLLDSELMTARLTPLAAKKNQSADDGSPAPRSIPDMASALRGEVTNFFSHLVQKPYDIPSNLVTHIAFPIHSVQLVGKAGTINKGVTYTDPADEAANPASFEGPLPAAFTFVGQFIDHDLTMNAVNLFEPQKGVVVDVASPLIDLDSVYGPRSSGFLPDTAKPDDLNAYLYDKNGRFKLNSGPSVDLVREMAKPDLIGQPVIADKRNDENQLILQIHLLIMRHHNKLLDEKIAKNWAEAYQRTLFTWQYIVLNDYLSRIIDSAILKEVTDAIRDQTYKGLKHVPLKNVQTGRFSITMPHEFAIGFRFGHSQLKPEYKINKAKALRLFDNTMATKRPGEDFGDLRGGQFLRTGHVIDWDVFLGKEYAQAVKGNQIDDKVTSVVFDLPESTIPDDVKAVGNLPFRNLARSRQIGLCGGEDLAGFYGVTSLTEKEVEPDIDRRDLYRQNGGTFRTPLWFYLLREAQLKGSNGGLGPLGSRLVSEVIVGGIYYNEPSLRLPNGFKPTHLPLSDPAHGYRLIDLAHWATT